MFQRQWRFLWGHTARHVGILVPGPGIKLVPPAVEAQSLNRWTSREVPKVVKMLFCFPCITYRCLSPTTRKVFSRLLLILEKEMAPHSSTLTWKIPWSDEPGRLQSMGSLRLGHDWETSLSLSCIGEGNGNLLQCSWLESPRDGGAWWAAIYGVTQSQSRLKRVSSSSSVLI